MLRTRLGIAAAVGALLAGVVVMPAAAQDKGTLKIGITLPLSGAARADGGPAERGAQLAIDQANEAGGVGGYMFETVVLDHAVNGQYNAAQGAADMQTLANDPNVIGVVGPYNSDVAAAQIPISNAAGLLQCSPANTRIALTKLPDALTYRPTKPDAISYIRVAASDAFQGPGVADYAYNKLGLRNIFVLDDQTGFGVGVSDTFQAQFELFGGSITRQGAAPDTTDFTGVVSADPAGCRWRLLRWRDQLGWRPLPEAAPPGGQRRHVPRPGRDQERVWQRRGVADPDRWHRRRGRHGRVRGGHLRFRGPSGLRGGVCRALQGRAGLQDGAAPTAALPMHARPSSFRR